ncbi:hypothetical protein Peetri_00167 [Pseudomonas phage vB_PpuM-Peetri]
MSRNNQVMVWEGTYESLIAFLTPQFRKHVGDKNAPERWKITVAHIYRTSLPDVWAWTREPYSDSIRLALDLELHIVIDLGVKPPPTLQLV